jgi:hypothetical protein
MYEFAKAFASPIVTLIAAVIAGCITYTFARIQAGIAASQRDIALEKLKFDLSLSRHEIYEATKVLLEYVPSVTDMHKSDASRIRSLYVKLDEARFYFPPDIRAVLKDIHDGCERYLVHLAERDGININTDDGSEFSRMAKILRDDQAFLRKAYASLPQTFEKTLAFKQLTTLLS